MLRHETEAHMESDCVSIILQTDLNVVTRCEAVALMTVECLSAFMCQFLFSAFKAVTEKYSSSSVLLSFKCQELIGN